MSDTDKAIVLTDAQTKAFRSLKNAFEKCASVGLEIHGELETLYAVNKKGLGSRYVVVGSAESTIISDEAEYITPKAFKGCSADDGLGIG